MDHLLYPKRGGGNAEKAHEEEEEGGEIAELRLACFMGLVSFLSGRAEVLRVEPRLRKHLHNAVARSMIQTATLTEEPLTAAGLDGTGQVIQVGEEGEECMRRVGEGRVMFSCFCFF